MLLPGFLLGTFAEVRRPTSRYLQSVCKGESPALDLVDTRSEPGLVVIDDDNGFQADQRNFQMHAIFEVADGARFHDKQQGIFDAVASQPWGPLALLGSNVNLLRFHRVIAEASWATALSTTLKHWDEYCAEGERFALGVRRGSLWALGAGLKAGLGHRGISTEELLAPLPEGGLRALLARHPEKFGCVLGTGPVECAGAT
jgi:hypothetical protein